MACGILDKNVFFYNNVAGNILNGQFVWGGSQHLTPIKYKLQPSGLAVRTIVSMTCQLARQANLVKY